MGSHAASTISHIGKEAAGYAFAPVIAPANYIGGLERGGFKGGSEATGAYFKDPSGYLSSSHGRATVGYGMATEALVAGAAVGAAGAVALDGTASAIMGTTSALSAAGAAQQAGTANQKGQETAARGEQRKADAEQARLNAGRIDPTYTPASYSMALSQRLAASAGGTLFATPRQYADQISNQGNRSQLVGA